MRDEPTVLVTGVGDTVGQALVKAARSSAVSCRVLGSDRDKSAVGFGWVDETFLLPHCYNVDAYLRGVREVCAGEGVGLILPGSEKELELLAANAAAIRSETGAVVVGSSPEVLAVAMDKWETCRFLERAGLSFPRYARSDHREDIERLIAEVSFPLIAKPVRGTGARGLAKVYSLGELEQACAAGVPFVVQECLEPAEEEYSVEIYTLKNGEQAGDICYRRDQLIAGDTYKAKVMPHEAAQREARAIAAALGAQGPCNVQMRVTERGPVTFEINPRFSGGVAMRAHFGFNEVEFALRDLVLDEPLPELRITSGLALRFWEEAYIDDAATIAAPLPNESSPLATAAL
ncbi:MAG: ATP-grasp domain-containing protein [Verrucomicrobiota bacterium]|nr:ATP-grasp domain-containing protein [Verrucomicrobiota bacterium]